MQTVKEKISYIAKRDVDGTPWSDHYFYGGYAFAHTMNKREATRAATPEELIEKVKNYLNKWVACDLQANGNYSIIKIVTKTIVDTEVLDIKFDGRA